MAALHREEGPVKARAPSGRAIMATRCVMSKRQEETCFKTMVTGENVEIIRIIFTNSG
jgi:hypothetical protein